MPITIAQFTSTLRPQIIWSIDDLGRWWAHRREHTELVGGVVQTVGENVAGMKQVEPDELPGTLRLLAVTRVERNGDA